MSPLKRASLGSTNPDHRVVVEIDMVLALVGGETVMDRLVAHDTGENEAQLPQELSVPMPKKNAEIMDSWLGRKLTYDRMTKTSSQPKALTRTLRT